MRGKRFPPRRNRTMPGLIPAHAGKTTPRRKTPPALTAHPRACGENRLTLLYASGGSGSSPRMRGKPSLSHTEGGIPGLIPAHAGKTTTADAQYSMPKAHPRACGENLKCERAARNNGGSSPRMRGKPLVDLVRAARPGLIPAHAGKTTRAYGVAVQAPAHPRACGENSA